MPAKDRSSKTPRDYLHQLEQRVALLEEQLQEAKSGQAPAPGRESDASWDADLDRSEGDDLASMVGTLSLNATGSEPTYLGPSSVYAFTRFLRPSLRSAIGSTASRKTYDDGHKILVSEPWALPDQDTAIKLSSAYFQNIHTQYPFLQETAFREWEEALADPFQTIYDPAQLFFVTMIYAIGATLIPGTGCLSEQLYASAMLFIDDVLCHDNLKKLAGQALRQCLPLDIEQVQLTPMDIIGTSRASVAEPPTMMTYAIHGFRIRILLGRIQTALYSDCSLTAVEKYARAENLSTALGAWWAETPPPRALPEGGALSFFMTPDFYNVGYNYALLQLYRVQIADRKTVAPDEIFIKCLHAARNTCHGFRRQFVGKPTAYTWSAVHELFLAGLTYIYCLWASSACQRVYRYDQVSSTCRVSPSPGQEAYLPDLSQWIAGISNAGSVMTGADWLLGELIEGLGEQ
ncbi:hypothetical protein MY10362_007788 [Beauveria mimosiformis]